MLSEGQACERAFIVGRPNPGTEDLYVVRADGIGVGRLTCPVDLDEIIRGEGGFLFEPAD